MSLSLCLSLSSRLLVRCCRCSRMCLCCSSGMCLCKWVHSSHRLSMWMWMRLLVKRMRKRWMLSECLQENSLVATPTESTSQQIRCSLLNWKMPEGSCHTTIRGLISKDSSSRADWKPSGQTNMRSSTASKQLKGLTWASWQPKVLCILTL